MPKQIWKIDEFHGGINSHADPRDILNNELAVATDVAVNELGKIRNLGGNAEEHAQPDARGGTEGLQPGYGLFQFSHDMDGADASADLAVGLTNYLALTDTRTSSTTTLDISAGGGTWSRGDTSGAGVGFSSAVSAKADIYYVDGALRVNDADFGAGSSPTWYGYVGDNGENKNMMENASTPVALTQLFYDRAAKPEKPLSSSFRPDEASVRQDTVYSADGDEIGGLVATDEETVTDIVEASNIATAFGGSSETIKQIEVEIIVDPKSAYYNSMSYWKYDFSIKQDDGDGNFSNIQSISDVDGFGSIGINSHIFEFSSPITIGSGDTKDWLCTLTTDDFDTTNLAAIKVVSIEFVKASANYGAHPATALTKHSFHVSFDQSAGDITDAFGWAETWEVGMSLIYDGNQESLITPLYDEGDFSKKVIVYTQNARPPDIAVFCQYSTSWNPRVTGAVLYMKRTLDKQWYPQVEMNFIKGEGTAVFSNKKRAVTYTSIGGEAHYIFQFLAADFLEPQLAITYESRTGISHEEKSISSMWKTSCVANRRAYLGNLKVFYEDGTTELHNDKMIRSLPNKFDIFPISESVDVSINDGESIIALVEFNDRILQFKERTLYIVNASQDTEFLEDKLPYRGISHKASVFKTEYGVVWANNNGCYFYDGKTVNDLLEKDGRPLILQKNWEDFLGTYPLVGYSPKKKQVIVVDDISNNNNGAGDPSDGSCYIFDMITRSWVQGAAGTFDATSKSNFVIDWNGDLLHAASSVTDDAAGDVALYKWDDGADTTAKMSLVTKDIDFGTPSQKKSVKKVYLTYKGDATNVQVQYGKDGITPASNFYKITSGTDGSSSNANAAAKSIAFDAGTTDWLCAELKPSAGSVTCNSFGIKISGDATELIADDFEINDISIVYRPKSVK